MIDQLNIPIEDTEVYNTLRAYFEPMEIDEEQVDRRTKTAYDFYEVMLFFFSLVSISIEYNRLERTYLIEQLRERWLEACENNVEINDYISDYADQIVTDIVVVTMSHLLTDEKTSEAETEAIIDEDNYWDSEERALGIAENASNVVIGYAELEEAIANGFTQKTWVTMRDSKVRETHYLVDGETIPIEDSFVVGDSLMLMPCDYDNAGAEETANCRCSLEFS